MGFLLNLYDARNTDPESTPSDGVRSVGRRGYRPRQVNDLREEKTVVSVERPWIDEVEREIAAMESDDLAVTEQLQARANGRAGSSVVYSIRLDPFEVAALERRATAAGVRPTVFARNLIRSGLSASQSDARSAALRRVEHAVAELGALIS
jgi:hypothetical protein